MEMGIWSPSLNLKNRMIQEEGSVQKITEIPEWLKDIYKTVTEIKQWVVVDMAIDRGCFIDQSQSLNIHFDQPDFQRLGILHFYTWLKVSYAPGHLLPDPLGYIVELAFYHKYMHVLLVMCSIKFMFCHGNCKFCL